MEPETQSHMSPQEWEWIQSYSQTLGFLECAIIPLIPEPRFESYAEWIGQNYHGPLEYLARNMDKRADPRLLGSCLNSAVVFLHPYPNDFSSQYIARYAWGKDYHHIIHEKLGQLSHNFQKKFASLQEDKVCVDTVPLLERSLAERSGLGWIGKNGCLISRKHGSFFLLAIWLVSLEIPISTISNPGHFHCGSCTRCLEACPTQAFIRPGALDASLCLSTLTIENRTSIHPIFFSSLHSQAFGCDICQTVCPWNNKKTPLVGHELLPPLNQLLTCSEMDFRAYFRKTALERPGWAGLRRNFLILAAHDPNIADEVFIHHFSHNSNVVQKTAQDLLAWRKSKKD